MIRMLLGLTPASAGTMSLLGMPVPAMRAKALARVGAIVEEPRFYPQLSGRENLRVVAAAWGPTPPPGSHPRWPGWGWPTAPTTRSAATCWACASGWAWPGACWPIRSC